MRLTKIALAVEIVVVLGLFVEVEWVAHVLTNTREDYVFALLFWGVYLAIRLATPRESGPPDQTAIPENPVVHFVGT
jgi:hypothetical protein